MKNTVLLMWIILLVSSTLTGRELISSEKIGGRTLDEMQAAYGGLMQNGVNLFRINYATKDLHGKMDTASGLIVLPMRDETLAYPLLLFAHGTVSSRDDVPSKLRGGWEGGLVFGGLSYIAVLPDYLGLGDSRGFHPYVHADSEASASIDMIYAAREFAQQQGWALNGQLFITGYSQGGHAAMATFRELEKNHAKDLPVTAAAPLSGPYSISGEMRDLILAEKPYYFPAYLPFTALSYDYVYGLFDDPGAYFKSTYAAMIRQFQQEKIDLFQLNTKLIDQLEKDTGASIPAFMIRDSIIAAVKKNPDHPLNRALADNDVYDWKARAPVRLFYCQSDDQVVYTNSVVAGTTMKDNGTTDIEAIDVNPKADHGKCVRPALIATALFFNQHRVLEPPASARE